MSYPPELIAERKRILLDGLDPAHGVGLEIGPLAWPIVGKQDGDVTYVDHFDTATLRDRYKADPNVPVDAIVPVDALWGARTLDECVGGRRFDYVIASHVGEHVPDLVTWLAECDAVLRPGGDLRIVLPDCRFSFDVLRRLTTTTDLLTAHLVRARRPQAREVLDFMLHYAPKIEAWAHYEGRFDLAALRPHWSVEQAMSFARRVLEVPDHYEDVHCWTFTPGNFARCMAILAEAGLTRFGCAGFTDTAPPWFEFYAVLRPTDDRAAAAASWRQMADAARDPLPGSAAARQAVAAHGREARIAELSAQLAARERELAWAQARIAAMEQSTSWRATRLLRSLRRGLATRS